MAWSVEHTDEFAGWYAGLSEWQQAKEGLIP
jgi:hypothetical protein